MRRALVAALLALMLIVVAVGADLAGLGPGLLRDTAAGALKPGPADSSGASAPLPTPVPVLPPGPPAEEAGRVLAPADTLAPRPTRTGVEAALAPGLATPALGPSVGAVVVDLATGEALLERDPDTGRVPASLTKLFTGATALEVLGSQRRLRTRVVAGSAPGEVVLVGDGDSTLTVAEEPPGTYPRHASLRELATATAEHLRAVAGSPGSAGPAPALQPVSVRVDDSLYGGVPSLNPAWEPGYVPGGVVAPVSALALDGGRVDPALRARAPDPAVAAGEAFARLLAETGVPVSPGVVRGVAAPGADELASVSSPVVAVLVEEMLRTSDNDLAEALLRRATVESGGLPTPEAGTALVARTAGDLGLPPVRLLDGSGLARGSSVPAAAVAGLLVAAGSEEHPRLRPLLTGLPVAGFTGTLAERFAGPARSGAGAVRAKTGTLNGVHGLAGVATDVDGRALAFALMTDAVPLPSTLDARATLDQLAATLAGCGCR